MDLITNPKLAPAFSCGLFSSSPSFLFVKMVLETDANLGPVPAFFSNLFFRFTKLLAAEPQ
jgi:hypothetical protein